MEEKSLCDLCLDVLSGVCTDEERRAFERHLEGCEACRAEMEELRIVWEALPADMEEIEPPEDLKKQVMDAALAADADMRGRQAEDGLAKKSGGAGRLRRTRSFMIAASAVAFILLAAGTVWNLSLYRERAALPLPIEQALHVPAAEIDQLVSLRPTEQEGDATGFACVVGSGQNKQFVVYLFGAAPTTGEQAYQVWLVKDGVRSSAGTMRVADDGRGIGVLAMPIAADSLSFDRIGITLEPDDRGSEPRGEKMFGSA